MSADANINELMKIIMLFIFICLTIVMLIIGVQYVRAASFNQEVSDTVQRFGGFTQQAIGQLNEDAPDTSNTEEVTLADGTQVSHNVKQFQVDYLYPYQSGGTSSSYSFSPDNMNYYESISSSANSPLFVETGTTSLGSGEYKHYMEYGYFYKDSNGDYVAATSSTPSSEKVLLPISNGDVLDYGTPVNYRVAVQYQIPLYASIMQIFGAKTGGYVQFDIGGQVSTQVRGSDD